MKYALRITNSRRNKTKRYLFCYNLRKPWGAMAVQARMESNLLPQVGVSAENFYADPTGFLVLCVCSHSLEQVKDFCG